MDVRDGRHKRRRSWQKSPPCGAARARRGLLMNRRPPPPAPMNHRVAGQTGDPGPRFHRGANENKPNRLPAQCTQPCEKWGPPLGPLFDVRASTGQRRDAAGDGRPTLSALRPNRRHRRLAGDAAEENGPSGLAWNPFAKLTRTKSTSHSRVEDRRRLGQPKTTLRGRWGPPRPGLRSTCQSNSRDVGNGSVGGPLSDLPASGAQLRASRSLVLSSRATHPVGRRLAPGRAHLTSLCKSPWEGNDVAGVDAWCEALKHGQAGEPPRRASPVEHVGRGPWTASARHALSQRGRWLPSTPIPVVPLRQCRLAAASFIGGCSSRWTIDAHPVPWP